MATRKTLKCFKCKKVFNSSELVSYCKEGTETPHNYCPKCLEEIQWYEKYINTVCRIFHLLAPGPRINKEHKLLIEKGYTDRTITECLEYIYDIKKAIKPTVATLYFVNADSINEMMEYKRNTHQNPDAIVSAMTKMTFKEYIVPIKEAQPRKKEIINPDDYLDYFNGDD